MTTALRAGSFCIWLAWTCAATAVPPDAATLLREGERAFADGLPQVAVGKFDALLRMEPPPDVRRQAVLAMGQALVVSGESAPALELLTREFPGAAGDPSVLYLRAQAQAALGRWEEALAGYTAAAEGSHEAGLGRVEALIALHRNGEALEACRKLAGAAGPVGALARLRGAETALDASQIKEAASFLLGHTSNEHRPFAAAGRSVKTERNYLLGRLRLAQKQTALAAGIFAAAAAHPEGSSERLLACNFRGWAEACLAQGKLAQAEDVRESFIVTYPRSRYL